MFVSASSLNSIPAMFAKCNCVAGLAVPIPTLLLLPSTNSILASPLDSTRKSRSTEPSLNTASVALKDNLSVLVPATSTLISK